MTDEERKAKPKVDFAEIQKQVQENTRRLDSCILHDFEQPTKEAFEKSQLRAKFTCANCGGQVDLTRYVWYTKGLEDGRLAARG